jgi:hypothetical protein
LEKVKTLETTVAALLLVTSTVVLACIVVDYAVTIVQQTLNTDNIPQLARIKNIENSLLNQTDNLFNQTAPELPGQPPP